jgi:hypothetical protein
MTDFRQEVLHKILEALQTPNIAKEIREAWEEWARIVARQINEGEAGW